MTNQPDFRTAFAQTVRVERDYQQAVAAGRTTEARRHARRLAQLRNAPLPQPRQLPPPAPPAGKGEVGRLQRRLETLAQQRAKLAAKFQRLQKKLLHGATSDGLEQMAAVETSIRNLDFEGDAIRGRLDEIAQLELSLCQRTQRAKRETEAAKVRAAAAAKTAAREAARRHVLNLWSELQAAAAAFTGKQGIGALAAILPGCRPLNHAPVAAGTAAVAGAWIAADPAVEAQWAARGL